jgi:hypothetical protein
LVPESIPYLCNKEIADAVVAHLARWLEVRELLVPVIIRIIEPPPFAARCHSLFD